MKLKYLKSYNKFKNVTMMHTWLFEQDLESAFDPPSEFDNSVDLSEVSDHSMDVSVDIETVKNNAIKEIKKKSKESSKE